MFKRFNADSDCSTSTQTKTSVQRGIKNFICTSHPKLESDDLDELLPKKPPLMQYKVSGGNHITLYCQNTLPIFFESRDGPILPTLKFVHRYSDLGWTSVTVDEGAIPFILGGANIMCPGLTNPGGRMPEDEVLEKGRGVIIFAEGKEHAIACGIMKLSSEEIRSKNKGIGVEVCHFMGDGLFNTNDIS